ncbi:MAG: hypothetical protein WCA85_11775 [Paraburkholderia sp.]|uniref:hypothetical protein n=1 Tax=Paraburkholderia sp. TaxID=1926495 RepID=UPI003C38F068
MTDCAADASDIDSTRGMKFENSGLMYQAAVEGIGIAIAQAVLVRQDLRSGVPLLCLLWRHYPAAFKGGILYFLIRSST